MNQSIEILEVEFKKVRFEYLLMLHQKYRRIFWYEDYIKYLKKSLKEGFSITKHEVWKNNLIDNLLLEIRKEKEELNAWIKELNSDFGPTTEIKSILNDVS